MKKTEKQVDTKTGLYFIYDSLDLENLSGIEKKILKQKDLFEELGILMNFIVLRKINNTFWNYKSEYSKYDFVYFRKGTIIDNKFISFFSEIKKDNPKMKVFMDIPTFPYEGEFDSSLKSKFALLIDRACRRKLVGLIDRIVVTGQYDSEKIWGVKAITIINGIDVNDVKPRKTVEKSQDEIIISCIAKFSPWHGYERIIGGLNDYYQAGNERKVKILMVGDGPEKDYYEKLVYDFDIRKYVTFTGQLNEKNLDDIYGITDIGCCSLARYKSNLDVIGDLKSREFLAKGIPMISGCQIDALINKEYKYCLYFPNDNSNINIQEVINFYDDIIKQGINIAKTEIRNFAVTNIDIRNTFKPVLKEVKNLLW